MGKKLHSQLTEANKLRQDIALIKDTAESKDLDDRIAALVVYARKQGEDIGDLSMARMANIGHGGQLLLDMAGTAGLLDDDGLFLADGKTKTKILRESRSKSGYADAVVSVGGQQTASEWIAIGRVSEDEWKPGRDGYLSYTGVLNRGREIERGLRGTPKLPRASDLGIHHIDFREHAEGMADESVPLIFTDPPYDSDGVELIRDLMPIADRILAPGGSLIFYCGHLQVGDMIASAKLLRLWWICCCLHLGPKTPMTKLGYVAGWKPILHFCKAPMRYRGSMMADVVSHGQEKSEGEKGAGDWQQSQGNAEHFIKHLTTKGMLVFDPMCGTGTTCVAAKHLGRKWIGCDVDAAAIAKARERLE